MGIAKIFAAIAPELPPEVTLLGPESRGSHDAAPLIRWHSGTAAHGPPRRLNGLTGDGSLWSRQITVPVEIWGRTEEETEGLLVLFVNIVHRGLSQHSYALAGEQWSHEGPITPGVLCVLNLVLSIPIPRTPKPTVPAPAIVLTQKINDHEV